MIMYAVVIYERPTFGGQTPRKLASKTYASAIPIAEVGDTAVVDDIDNGPVKIKVMSRSFEYGGQGIIAHLFGEPLD